MKTLVKVEKKCTLIFLFLGSHVREAPFHKFTGPAFKQSEVMTPSCTMENNSSLHPKQGRCGKKRRGSRKNKSSLLKMMAVCLTSIANRSNSLLAKDLITVLKDEKFDLIEFRETVESLADCENIVDCIVSKCVKEHFGDSSKTI